jgi:hypothetical protein
MKLKKAQLEESIDVRAIFNLFHAIGIGLHLFNNDKLL